MRRITLTTSLVASVLAALAVAVPASATNRSHHYTPGTRSAPLHAKKATKRGDPNPYAGWTQFARGYFTQGNNVPTFGNSEYAPGNAPYQGLADYARGYTASHPAGFPG
jgi:hypothetical protein